MRITQLSIEILSDNTDLKFWTIYYAFIAIIRYVVINRLWIYKNHVTRKICYVDRQG